LSAPGILEKAKALQRQGDLAGAEAGYRQVLTKEPDHVEALNNLGNVLRGLKRPDEAVDCLRRALALKAGHPAILTNLGLALGDLRQFEEAMECHRRAVLADPELAPTHNNLGLSLKALGRLPEAEASFRRALALKPDFAEALNNLGNVLRARERFEEAAAVYRRAIEVKPGYPDAHYNLANTLRNLGRPEEGARHFRKGLELAPRHAEAQLDRGKALQVAGRLEEAKRLFALAIERNPALIEAHKSLVGLLTQEPDPDELALLEDLARRERALPQRERILLHFTLARVYELSERYDQAFQSLSKANRLKRRSTVYDMASELDYVARLKRVFSQELLTAKSAAGHLTTVPIFIVGFPRSGTTLTEQILASHPQVHGAGELGFMTELLAELSIDEPHRLGFPESIAFITEGKLSQLGEAYAARLSALAPDAGSITDKMPDNYFLLGLIRLMLPRAKLLHVQRNPMDTCMSCYATHFTQGHPYAYDLGELGQRYRMYRELMEHWNAVLPKGSMLEVKYEDVIEDLEGQARRILDYCGLPWDDRCLSFHEAERPVETASLAQVRRPVYGASVGRWRAYAKHLGPLMKALGPAAADYE
jgi:tetratricopeptide (TPR) repeat protein